MGVLVRAIRDTASSLRSITLGPYNTKDPALRRLFGYEPVAAGINVTEETALGYPPVHAAVSLIAGQLGALPLHLYRRVGESRERYREHPLDRLIEMPNAEQTGYLFRRTLTGDALVHGWGLAEIQRDEAARPVALWRLDPDRVDVLRDVRSRALRYRVRGEDAVDVHLSADDVLVLLFSTRDGYSPVSPLLRNKQAVGLGLAIERYGAQFFGNGASASGVFRHPGKLSDTAHAHIKESLKEHHTREHRWSPIVLEEGMEWTQLSVPPNNGQFLESRLFQVNDVARIYNLPPTMIGGALEGGLQYQNPQAEAQRFVTQTLVPLATLWEQELDRKLIARLERGRQYFEHTFEGLLRADTSARFTAYETAIRAQFMTPDEARIRENLPLRGAGPTPTNGGPTS